MSDNIKYSGYLEGVKKIYFTGIGGIGMCGLAEYLLEKGYSVSGSDPVRTHITQRLVDKGAKVNNAQESSNIDKSIGLLVYTSAVKDDNPELSAARALGITCIKRAALLGGLVNDKYLIAVSGTHGKTTTTGMIAKIMIDAGLDPTVFVGGNLDFLGGASVRTGKSKYAVVEADEYDRSFLTLEPDLIIINNIELDHTDIYADEGQMLESFMQFTGRIKSGGKIVCNGDDKNIIALTRNAGDITCFGKESANKLAVLKIGDDYSEFSLNNIIYRAGVTGYHNIYNATAAVLTACELGISAETISKSLSGFHGVSRRLEKKYSGGITVYDDYAHHPTEIYYSLKSLKDISEGNLIVVFQPHTYSRVVQFYADFARSLETADNIILMPVYAAREKQPAGVSSQMILDELIKGGKPVVLVSDETEMNRKLKEISKAGDLIVFQGAGNITDFCGNFIKTLG